MVYIYYYNGRNEKMFVRELKTNKVLKSLTLKRGCDISPPKNRLNRCNINDSAGFYVIIKLINKKTEDLTPLFPFQS